MAAVARALGRQGARGLVVLLPLLFLAVALFWPLAEVLGLGLREGDRWTLARLGRLLGDPYVRHLLLFTTQQAVLSALLSLGLGFPLGWLLTRYHFPGKRLLKAYTLVPFVLPSITVALGFVLFFGHQGYVNRFLQTSLGLSEPPLRVLYTMWAVILAHAFYNAPVVARFVHVAWEGLDPQLGEAARVLGARPGWVFLTVTWPLLLPAVVSAFALVFVLCFLSFSIPLALGGVRYATAEVGVYLFARVYADFPRAAALATLMLGFSLALTYVYLKGGGVFTARSRGVRLPTLVRLGCRPQHLFWLLYLVVAGLVLLGPVAAIVADSFVRPFRGQAPTWAWYHQLASGEWDPVLGTTPLAAVGTSLTLATLATASALALGLLVAGVLRRFRSKLLETVLLAPLAVSSVVLGLALLLAFRRPPLSYLGGGLPALVLAHTLILYPFAVRTILPLWNGLDPSWVEAARTLGASRAWAFFTVELPLLREGLLAAGAFAFALSLGEMTAVAMLAGPGLTTIPMAIYQFLGNREYGAAAAMATVLIAVTFAVVWIWDRLGSAALGERRERA